MNNSRRGAVLTIMAVVALWCEGCSWIVAPDTRQEWADRLRATEATIAVDRSRLEFTVEKGKTNCMAFIDEIDALDGDDDGSIKRYNIDQINLWHGDQIDRLESIKDCEQDLALLRDEIEEGGF